MKKLILLCLMATSTILFAQEGKKTEIRIETKASETNDASQNGADSIKKITIIKNFKDTISIEMPNKKSATKKVKKTIDEFYFDLGVGGFLDNGSVTMSPANDLLSLNYGKSVGVGFTWTQSRKLIKDKFRFGYGLGLESSNYRIESHHRMEVRNGILGYVQPDSNFTYSKTKLNPNYLNLPINIEFRSKPNKYNESFLFYFGVEGSLLLTSKFKQKYDDGRKTVKSKYHDSYQLSPFRLSYVARVGYGGFYLFGRYSATPMFQNKNNNPDLNQFNIGLSFGIE